MRRLLMIGTLVLVAVVVLARVIFSVREGFQVGGSGPSSTLNTMTVCPTGSKMFMYGGSAYCCSGVINPDADELSQACRPLLGPSLFCSLGPSAGGIQNCLETRTGLMQAEGESRCPPSKPNFCQADNGSAKCCAGLTNAAITDCVDPTPGAQCAVLPAGTNPLASANTASCDFMRIKELDVKDCPQGYNQTIVNGTGTFTGLTFCGCTNMTQTCYTDDMIARLRKLGNVTTLLPCSQISSGGSTPSS